MMPLFLRLRAVSFTALLLVLTVSARAQSFQWAQRLGNIKSDKVTCVKTDALGYVYIAGYFSNSLTLGTNNLVLNYVANATSKEAFVAKLDSTGVCLWARAGGQHYDDRVLGMDVTDSGEVVITGTYWEGSGINFSGTYISGNYWGDQPFVVRYDKNGNLLWGSFAEGEGGDDQGLDVAVDNAGNSYVAGFMSSNMLHLGNSGITVPALTGGYEEHSYWLAKINKFGVWQWGRTFGNLPWDTSHYKYLERDIAVCVDDAGGVYVTGGFDHNRKFGNDSLKSKGGYDIFVIKYDTLGAQQWTTGGGSNKDDWSNGICADRQGHIYITGEHRDSLIVDTVLVKNFDKRDCFVMKLDATTGKAMWGKRAGSDEGSERGNDVVADEECNVYVVGDIWEGAKFGSDITVPAGGALQAFVAKISTAGDWQWAVTGGGGDEEDRANAVAKGHGSQVYAAGFFRSPATYGTYGPFISSGNSDGFFARLMDSTYGIKQPFALNAISDTLLCPGEVVTRVLQAHSYISIAPMSGVTIAADGSTATFNPAATTTYTLIAASASFCPVLDTISFTVTRHTNPFTLPALRDTIFCLGGTATFMLPQATQIAVNPTTGVSWNADSTSLSITPAATISYTITANDFDGKCWAAGTSGTTVSIAPDPVAAFSVSPEVAVINYPVFTMTNTSTGADSYVWLLSGQPVSTAVNPTFTQADAGTYCWTLVATAPYGCLDSAEHCATVLQPHDVQFPTAFTPNGDARNATFRPILIYTDATDVKDYKLIVVNRFGEAVFETKDVTEGWNGAAKLNGLPVDMGTYRYYCRLQLVNGKVMERKGDVTVIY